MPTIKNIFTFYLLSLIRVDNEKVCNFLGDAASKF